MPNKRTRPLRPSDFPPEIREALTRPARPGEIERLLGQAQSEPDRVQPVPKQVHELLTPAELAQQQRDSGYYPTLDEQVDELITDYNGAPPPHLLRELVMRHKEMLRRRMMGQ